MVVDVATTPLCHTSTSQINCMGRVSICIGDFPRDTRALGKHRVRVCSTSGPQLMGCMYVLSTILNQTTILQ